MPPPPTPHTDRTASAERLSISVRLANTGGSEDRRGEASERRGDSHERRAEVNDRRGEHGERRCELLDRRADRRSEPGEGSADGSERRWESARNSGESSEGGTLSTASKSPSRAASQSETPASPEQSTNDIHPSRWEHRR